MSFVVYMIKGPTPKRYIGVTRWGVQRRFAAHKAAAGRGVGKPLYYAMRKYGAENFTVEILTECVDDLELVACERGLIAQYGTMAPHGYNLSAGGDGGARFWMTAAQRERIREYATGRPKSAETRAKLRAFRLGSKRDKSSTGKQAATLKERFATGTAEARAEAAKLRTPAAIAAYDAYNTEQRRLKTLANQVCPRVFFRVRCGATYPQRFTPGYKRSPESIEKQRASMAATKECRAALRKGKKQGSRQPVGRVFYRVWRNKALDTPEQSELSI